LARLTQAGYPIGSLAELPREKLAQLLREKVAPGAEGPTKPGGTDYLGACLEAVRQHDQSGLEAALTRAEVGLGVQGMLMQVAAPLAQTLGDLWREGTLSAAHEHFASAVLRSVLSRACRSFAPGTAAPVLIVATPAGQLHELGALLAAAAASNLGWRVIYLGPSLPAAEIAGAAQQHRARAVGLSLVYPEDDPALPDELAALRRLLPASTALLAGGRALGAYRTTLEQIGALQARDLEHLGSVLDRLRST
jgi:methylmalonyl-CoA mutase cobalamin-binding subunit